MASVQQIQKFCSKFKACTVCCIRGCYFFVEQGKCGWRGNGTIIKDHEDCNNTSIPTPASLVQGAIIPEDPSAIQSDYNVLLISIYVVMGFLVTAIAVAVIIKTGLFDRLKRCSSTSDGAPPPQRVVESLSESGESDVLLTRPQPPPRTTTSTPERSVSGCTPSPPSLSPVPDPSNPTSRFHSSDATMEAPEISPAPTEIFGGTFTIGPAPSSADSLATFENVAL